MLRTTFWFMLLCLAVLIWSGVGYLYAQSGIVVKSLEESIEDLQKEQYRIKTEEVYGSVDERERVKVTDEYPWSTIVALGGSTCCDQHNNCGPCCSGSVVDTHHILTAAHCLYGCLDGMNCHGDDKLGWKKRNFVVTPGQSAGLKPFGTLKASAACIPDEFTKITPEQWRNSRREHDPWDIAMLILDASIIEKTGSLGLKGVTLQPGMAVTLASYPKDKKPRGTLWVTDCWIHTVEGDLITHTCDSAGGSSGSPLYVYFEDNTRYVVGVHVGSGSFGRIVLPNRAVRINKAKRDFIRACKKAGLNHVMD